MGADIWIPPRERKRQLDERQRWEAEVHERIDRAAADAGAAKEVARTLRGIDSHLDLVFLRESEAFGLSSYRWHVVRYNPDAPDSFIPIEGPMGEYREPDSRVYDDVLSADLWNGRVEASRRERTLKREREQARAKERQREDRVEEMVDRVKAKHERGVSFTDRRTPWTYSAAARTERK